MENQAAFEFYDSTILNLKEEFFGSLDSQIFYKYIEIVIKFMEGLKANFALQL